MITMTETLSAMKIHRVTNDISAEEASAKLGITSGYLRLIENHSIGADKNLLKRMAELYRCSPSQLVDWTKENYKLVKGIF